MESDSTWEGPRGDSTTSGTTTSIARRPRTSRRRRGPGRAVSPSTLPSVVVHGVKFHAISEKRCLDHVLDELDAGRGGILVTPNLDHLNRCKRDMRFSAIVAEADVVVADGMPIVWASRLARTPLPERVAGSDLLSSLSTRAASRKRSVFLLGGDPGTAAASARILLINNPSLRIAGTHCPPFGFENDPVAKNAITQALLESNPDIVFVGLGSPKQEFLIEEIRAILPRAWWLGVGASFSFLCGDVKRAPFWMRCIGMEWVHRLIMEPRRLFHRYIVVCIPLGLSLLGKSLLRRFAGAKHVGEGSFLTSRRTDDATPISKSSITVSPQSPLSALQDSVPSTPKATTSSHVRTLHRLRAMVLLGGSVRPTALSTSIGRSVLDLPMDDHGSILNHWLAQGMELAGHAGLEQLPVRVMVNQHSPDPTSASSHYSGIVRVERDLSEYRGTGGVLRDLAADYADDDLILVANAAQILMDPLAAIAMALDRKSGHVSLVSHTDGTPSGVMLVSCKTLRLIPTSGYIDMKEQALPAIAARYDVTVMHRRRPTGMAIRSLADYVLALRHYHRRRAGKPALSDPLAEDWDRAFALIEDGANVDPRAHVHDSVVLKGATVESGAVLVRSVVCPGGVVRRDRHAVDQFVRCSALKERL